MDLPFNLPEVCDLQPSQSWSVLAYLREVDRAQPTRWCSSGTPRWFARDIGLRMSFRVRMMLLSVKHHSTRNPFYASIKVPPLLLNNKIVKATATCVSTGCPLEWKILPARGSKGGSKGGFGISLLQILPSAYAASRKFITQLQDPDTQLRRERDPKFPIQK